MPERSEPEWAAFVAIDWADQKHYWKLSAPDRPRQGELSNTPEAVDAWAAGLYVEFGGRPIAVCLEQSRGALVLQLRKYSHLVLYAVHPTLAARFRAALYPSGSKSDRGNTDCLLELLLHHRDHLSTSCSPTPPRLVCCKCWSSNDAGWWMKRPPAATDYPPG